VAERLVDEICEAPDDAELDEPGTNDEDDIVSVLLSVPVVDAVDTSEDVAKLELPVVSDRLDGCKAELEVLTETGGPEVDVWSFEDELTTEMLDPLDGDMLDEDVLTYSEMLPVDVLSYGRELMEDEVSDISPVVDDAVAEVVEAVGDEIGESEDDMMLEDDEGEETALEDKVIDWPPIEVDDVEEGELEVGELEVDKLEVGELEVGELEVDRLDVVEEENAIEGEDDATEEDVDEEA
jgi:hypothetical protein